MGGKRKRSMSSDLGEMDAEYAPGELPGQNIPTPEEKLAKKKEKKMASIDKSIKSLSKRQAKVPVIKAEPSEIKNKCRRIDVVLRKRKQKGTDKLVERLKKKKLREETGDENIGKGTTQTIETMRVKDDTFIENPDDEDIKGEEDIDEFAKYFNSEETPKNFITTNRRPRGGIFEFMAELKEAIPNTFYYPRKNFKIKDIIEQAKEKEYTNVLVFYEKHGNPHTLIHSHLPDGPTATYRVSGLKTKKVIKGHGNSTDHHPELIMNNFDTMLGHRVGRMFASLFP